jgi:lysophospholipase L1-like esterase
MPRLLLLVLALLVAPLTAAPEKWAAEIDKLTQADAVNPPPRGGVVFVGSSSIRRWDTLARDFPGIAVINRGFGGSQLADSVFYADRIILPYQPRTVVLYAGENDLNAGVSVEKVYADFEAFCAKVHAALPHARIVFLAMKPSPKRWHLRADFIRGNGLIAARCASDPRLTFVDVWPPMLGPDGEPRRELFVSDELHLNAQGYAIWTKLLADVLAAPKS